MAPAASSTERPAVIDIRYSTLCRPVQIDLRSFLIAMFPLAPPTRGSSKTAARRATAVGSNSVSASTVRIRSPRANRTPALIAGLRPQRVPWQITVSTRPCARARSAKARVSSVEPSSTTMISIGRKVWRCSDTIERSRPAPPLKVGMITLTLGLAADVLPSRRRVMPKKASDSSDRVYRGRSKISTENASRNTFACARSRAISDMRTTSEETIRELTSPGNLGSNRHKRSLGKESRIFANCFAANARRAAMLWKS